MPASLPAPQVTVVIPTRNRLSELARCLAAILESTPDIAYEIIVVDDGSEPPLTDQVLGFDDRVALTLLRAEGVGPARARNLGIAQARGAIVVFTDDDTIPLPGWVEAAATLLTSDSSYVGVTGPTTTPPYDHLYFHSVQSASPGSYLTCNIAYRRRALLEVGGFADIFPFPHAEDLDLGIRVRHLGKLGYTDAMTVVHPPRPESLLATIRRGRVMASDATLYSRHPDVYPLARYFSGAGYALFVHTRRWLYAAVRDMYGIRCNPWRALRFAAIASGYTLRGCAAIIFRRPFA